MQTDGGNNNESRTNKTANLKDGSEIILRLYRLEDKEALVSMYASMSPEALKWGMPPYDRARIERWTSDLTNNITLIARSEERVVGHLYMFRTPYERLKGNADLLIYIHQDFQNLGLVTRIMGKAIEIAKERAFHQLGL